MLTSWLIPALCLFVGCAFGFFVAALMAAAGRASRNEERWRGGG